jgi:hypothetical protein
MSKMKESQYGRYLVRHYYVVEIEVVAADEHDALDAAMQDDHQYSLYAQYTQRPDQGPNLECADDIDTTVTRLHDEADNDWTTL